MEKSTNESVSQKSTMKKSLKKESIPFETVSSTTNSTVLTPAVTTLPQINPQTQPLKPPANIQKSEQQPVKPNNDVAASQPKLKKNLNPNSPALDLAKNGAKTPTYQIEFTKKPEEKTEVSTKNAENTEKTALPVIEEIPANKNEIQVKEEKKEVQKVEEVPKKEEVPLKVEEKTIEKADSTPGKMIIRRQLLINLIEGVREKNDINNPNLPQQIKTVLLREEKSENTLKKENYKPGGNTYKPKNDQRDIGKNQNQMGNSSNNSNQMNASQNNSTINRGTNPSASKNPTQNYQPSNDGSVLTINREDDPLKMKLRSGANSWIKGKEKEATKNPEIKLEKELKFNLNLLSPDNYPKVKVDILERARKSQRLCNILVDLIIQKAWDEPKYTSTYAKLCFDLGSDQQLNFDEGADKKERGDKKKKNNAFKNVLLQSIQKAFEQSEVVQAKKKYEEMSEDEKKEYQQKRKKRILGNVNFIGELYLVKIISLKIITIVTSSMFDNFLNDYYENMEVEVKEKRFHEFELMIEGILTLFDKIGKHLEADKTNTKNSQENQVLNEIKDQLKIFTQDRNKLKDKKTFFGESSLSVDDIFNLLEFIRESCKITNRVKCLIENLWERRKNNWQDRLFGKEGPKTLSDLKREHERELDAIDQRAEEFYKSENYESRTSSRPSNARISSSGGSSFQVAGASESKQERETTRASLSSSANVPSNLNFSVNLNFNANREQRAPANVVSFNKLWPPHEIEDKLKDIFKKWEEGFEKKEGQEDIKYDEVRALADIEYTLKQSNPVQFIDRFLYNFYDTNKTELNKRAPILIKLYEDKLIKKEDFNHAFSTFFNKKAWEIVSDFPLLTDSLARIYNDFVERAGARFQDVELIYWKEDNKDFDIDNMDIVVDFFKDFVAAARKISKNGGEDLNALLENVKKVSDARLK